MYPTEVLGVHILMPSRNAGHVVLQKTCFWQMVFHWSLRHWEFCFISVDADSEQFRSGGCAWLNRQMPGWQYLTIKVYVTRNMVTLTQWPNLLWCWNMTHKPRMSEERTIPRESELYFRWAVGFPSLCKWTCSRIHWVGVASEQHFLDRSTCSTRRFFVRMHEHPEIWGCVGVAWHEKITWISCSQPKRQGEKSQTWCFTTDFNKRKLAPRGVPVQSNVTG